MHVRINIRAERRKKRLMWGRVCKKFLNLFKQEQKVIIKSQNNHFFCCAARQKALKEGGHIHANITRNTISEKLFL